MIISSNARGRFGIDEALLDSRGRIDTSTFHAARTICHRVNSLNHRAADPESLLRGAELYGLAMLDRIYRRILTRALKPGADLGSRGLRTLSGSSLNTDDINSLEAAFLKLFPAVDAAAPADTTIVADFLSTVLSNENPAAVRIRELIDDSPLHPLKAYQGSIENAETLFAPPPEAADSRGILDLLRRPFVLHPGSVREQLEYIRSSWGRLLGSGEESDALLATLGFLEEEERPFFGGGPGEQNPYVYSPDDREGFSEDQSWMPTVVMMAKNVLVWLHQISLKKGKVLTRLDQIPEDELETLARRGFTALWLIGIWQRSKASKRIKHLCGNPEAEASAYSLKNYEISGELGGWEALETLRIRAGKYGIRLASDMVPNHTGMDADWLYEHPEYYLQLPSSPYPSYTFKGENLSLRQDCITCLEDHYFERTDAAVVFRHEELGSGRVRYIYHGNDGTHMPWNDTAQLNYLNPQVREAVIQTILQVARNFPIIRFDAAMTLAREHIRRLWFPEPGKGGAVPSRAEHALSDETFNRSMPAEFWRDVVDRVAAEVPGTLLLAEAFWMMEGYFVRSLGMHRVYNSAFMNMLKNEENGKYRQTLKNTLEFDPEILKRFVNFMNNPDEDTAVAQFGTGDKYFGICTLLATMPGLPMFGHGQIEGFREKYGMEYSRAYHNEQPDTALVERHRKEIFPLLKMRPLFAEADNFTLYDLIGPSGINQNVFAYSNRTEDAAALVLYNNSQESAAGTVRMSVPYRERTNGGDLHQRSLGESLGIPDNPRKWLILSLHGRDLEFIRNCRTVARQGVQVVLPGYGCQVFTVLRIVDETGDGRYRQLADHLKGSGCIDIDREIRVMHMAPLHTALARALTGDVITAFRAAMILQTAPSEGFLRNWEKEYLSFLKDSAAALSGKVENGILKKAAELMRTSAAGLFSIALHQINNSDTEEEELAGIRGYLQRGFEMRREAPAVLAAWCLTEGLGALLNAPENPEASRSIISDLHLSQPIMDIFRGSGLSAEKSDYGVKLVKLVTEWRTWADNLENNSREALLAKLLEQAGIQDFLLVNRYDNVIWFSKDRFEDMSWWLFATAVISRMDRTSGELSGEINRIFAAIHRWLELEEAAGYRLTELLELLESGTI